ncbi:uncharacterized mitochondrial protein AtMg00810-like [Rutidosis leptorrhynchoides]|uniref:uncharacterized mitochondrial protein AtMg00810-like n=1 Tax=Rutidosis leptorrhynchoides TaxID=125765 RepID=UPI003A99684E
MHQPYGFCDSSKPDHVCLLKHSLYGLKQALRAWYQRCATFMSSIGFKNSILDHSLFVYHRGVHIAYLLLYVEDIILVTSSALHRESIMSLLHCEFAMKDLSSLRYFLGIAVTKNAHGFFLSQETYAHDIISRAGMVSCNTVKTPVDANGKLSNTGPSYANPKEFHSLAGALQYLTFTRPDISYAVQQICLYMHDSKLVSYIDADWGGCSDTRRSTSGYCVFLGRNVVSWSAKRQPTVSRSSAKEKYRGVANDVPESFQYQRTKHIEMDIHFVREKVARGQVRVLHIPTRFQLAKIFTKRLPRVLFEDFRNSLSIRPPPAQTEGLY